MRLKVIIFVAICVAIGFGLGNVHHSKTAKEITEKVEATTMETTKKVYKGIKENTKKIYEELNEE